ncbi:metallophosphoesterase family protein [Mesobacterium pallidum]|uniref:metallophosphoesterase family protein n=1 Tax=Mesobacterium pallidum TaxID=2872037 RepID=UPI001EE377FC|nr:metallophosphoesterase family protein [Mesobacterium pallidum]
MRILAFSDLHLSRRMAARLVETSAEVDLVIGAGDFCNMREGLAEAVALLDGLQAPMIAVPGNCESDAELRAAAPGWTVLHGEGTEVQGVKIFGLGYGVPETPFGAWSCDLPEETAAQMLDQCEATHLLVTHSPPKGIADVTSHGLSVGSTAIHAAVERLQPQWNLFGHIHDCWGQEGVIGATRCRNLGPEGHIFEITP